MSFNDSNVDNRLRYPVRGRVIVFTTSPIVEFLENNLKYSYPLYSVDTIADGYGLCFLVELNGFLTFAPDAYVKISNELNPYQQAYFDPKAFTLVKAADVIVAPPIVDVTVQSFSLMGYSKPGTSPSKEVFQITFTDTTIGQYRRGYAAQPVVGWLKDDLPGYGYQDYYDTILTQKAS